MDMASAGSATHLYTVQRALPDELSPGLSGVLVDRDEKNLFIRCVFEGPLTGADHEFMNYMQEAVGADLFPTMHVEVQAFRAEPETGSGVWVMRRPALVAH
ncbi:MAG TPA: hypothetical protein VK464_22520 [Symbiobacteriaceae bacterium]|jgi:hypothetical protein|nr:hypothetical protein [Symbiobacteriaceae bacterium]